MTYLARKEDLQYPEWSLRSGSSSRRNRARCFSADPELDKGLQSTLEDRESFDDDTRGLFWTSKGSPH